MILLDAYAVIAYLQDEPAAGDVQRLLGGGGCAVVSVNLVEVVDSLVRRRGIEVNDVRRVLAQLPVAAVGVDEAAALRAGELRAAHYRANTCEVSPADCLLAAAAGVEDRVATSDPHLARLLRAEGIGLVALPDRSGVRP